MSKQIERPNPKTADYQSKDSLVAQLNHGDPSMIGSVLYGLGSAFEANPLLSLKQKTNLLSALTDNGLLNYKANYLAAVVDASDMGEPDMVLGKVDESLDLVAWNIEKEADVQVKTVVAAKQLSEVQKDSAEEVIITTNLFNQAHLATQKESYLVSIEDARVQYRISLSRFYEVEQEVFGGRTPLGFRLVELGLATIEETDELGGLDFEGYKALRGYSELFDKLMALYFVKGFIAIDMVGRFKELQKVLHAGYTMGIRDAIEANEKLFGDDII